MHSKIGQNDEGNILVECNVCGTQRTVGTNDDEDDAVTADGGDDVVDSKPSTQGGIEGWGQ